MKPGKNLYTTHDYRQSYMQRIYEATVVFSLNYKSKINILKSRYGPAQEDISTEEAIRMFAEILSRHIFGDYIDLFRESLKQELIKAITHTIEGGVATCEPHSEKELLPWDSKSMTKKVSSDILTVLEK
jgi:hypothetical protein